AADFGLTDGTVFTTALNVDETGAPVSRVLLAAESKFDVGAYALQPTPVIELESVALSVAAPEFGDVVVATVSPEGATYDYQWYRVDDEGTATAISGATSATYTVGFADVNYTLRVVATGNGDYAGAVSADTAKIAAPTVVTVKEATQAALVEAVNVVADGGMIFFANSLAGSTITLTGSEIELKKNVAIIGGQLGITIDANEQSRIFNVGSGYEVELSGLMLTGGCTSSDGGAIYNRGSLKLSKMWFTGNAADDGGAIYCDYEGSLAVTNSTFTGNSSADNGGAIYIGSQALFTVTGSTFIGNSAAEGKTEESGKGGAIYSESDKLFTVTNSTFTENSAGNGADMGCGGAIYCNSRGSFTVTDSTFTGNS
ncbi:MAG: hypothetical protein HUK22_01080, partial [Thermoguttaceae bacterium]|nr:hypothetical protein [Thermoguttaceae bacterium]